MSDISKYDLEIQELKGEIKLLSERVSTIKDNHLKHIEEKKLILQKNQKKNGLPKLIWQLRKS